MATMRGRFIPKNPDKYIGNPNNIIFRSSWELNVLKFFDSSSAVLKYASEEIKIPYLKPTDGQVHYYYPDFLVVYRTADGSIRREILEIKPAKEAVLERAKTTHDKIALAINAAKWAAADQFAKSNNMTFRVLTEHSLFKQAPKKPKKAKASNK